MWEARKSPKAVKERLRICDLRTLAENHIVVIPQQEKGKDTFQSVLFLNVYCPAWLLKICTRIGDNKAPPWTIYQMGPRTRGEMWMHEVYFLLPKPRRIFRLAVWQYALDPNLSRHEWLCWFCVCPAAVNLSLAQRLV